MRIKQYMHIFYSAFTTMYRIHMFTSLPPVQPSITAGKIHCGVAVLINRSEYALYGKMSNVFSLVTTRPAINGTR